MAYFNIFYYFIRFIDKVRYLFRRLKPVSKVIILLLLAFVCVSFFFNVYGYSSDDNWSLGYYNIPYTTMSTAPDWGLYTASFVSNPKMLEYVNTLTSSTYYLSGDYYYFVFYDKFDGDMCGLLFKKTVLDDYLVELPMTLNNKGSGSPDGVYNRTYSGTIHFENLRNLMSSGGIRTYINGTWSSSISTVSSMSLSSDGLTILASGFNSTAHTIELPLLTDIPYQITYKNALGTSVIYSGSTTPYIANTYAELSALSSSTLNVVPNGSMRTQLTLVNETLNTEIFTINLSDDIYTQYYERLDTSDPFSDLAYKIPFSALPTFTYTSGQDFDWKITYFVTELTGPYVIHFRILSSYSGSNPVGGGTSPGSGGAGSSGGATSDDMDKLGDRIEGAIESSTDRILSDDLDESSMDIDTSFTDEVDNSSIVDLLTKMVDVLSKAFTPTDEVYTITIPVSTSRGGELVLTSDVISSHLPENSVIRTLIVGFWAFIFGKFLWRNASIIIEDVKTGRILNGPTKAILGLEDIVF